MKKQILQILKVAFPFLAVLLLWYFSVPFWNPAGVLALIPIFYYSFIKPADWFAAWAVIFCLLIDYKFDTLLFWTFMYCLLYAVNGFQNFVDLTRQKNDGILIFMGYFAVSSFILILSNWSFAGFIRTIWLILWTGILYIPFAAIARKVSGNDY